MAVKRAARSKCELAVYSGIARMQATKNVHTTVWPNLMAVRALTTRAASDMGDA